MYNQTGGRAREISYLLGSVRRASSVMHSAFAIFTVLLSIFENVRGARVLGLFPHTGKSHQMVFEPLLYKLAERGHQVTVVSFYPLKDPPTNYTDVSLEGIAPLGVETYDLSSYDNLMILLKYTGLDRFVRPMMEFGELAGMALNVCRKLVEWPALIEALQRDYDVVLVENFNSDCMLGLMHVYGIKAPTVALLSSGMLPWSTERMGATDNPSYVPTISTSFSDRMSYLERLENTFMQTYFKLWFRYAIQVKEQELIERHFGRKIPDLRDLSKNMSLMLLNTFHGFTGVRPGLPGIIEVGGMHLDYIKKTIPYYIERFLNESEDGVVLVSFGSLIKTSTMPKEKVEIIMNALSKLKQRVIWKFEDSGEEGNLTGNILRVRWMPQYELLHHKKVVAFVAHGGLLGMTEGISAGKPMLVVPFFADQPFNAAAAEAAGLAKVLSYEDLSEKSLSDGLKSILSAEMRLSARTASKRWLDRENKPLDTAVYWVERVARWGSSATLHSASRYLSFIEYTLIDVTATFLVFILIVVLILRSILLFLLRFVLGSPKADKQKTQ